MVYSCQGWKHHRPVNLHLRAVLKATKRRGSQLSVEWDSLSLTIFCTFKGNGNEVKGNFRKIKNKIKANVIVEMERKHVTIIQPEATDDNKNITYGTFLDPQRSEWQWLKEKEGWSQWAGSTSGVNPIQLCALTPFIIPPRAAIVSLLWMSHRQSSD